MTPVRHAPAGRRGQDRAPVRTSFTEWTSNTRTPLTAVTAGRAANPALGKFLQSMGSARSGRPCGKRFRRLRLGQFMLTPRTVDRPRGWRACQDRRDIEPGSPIVLAFDGSRNGDTTACWPSPLSTTRTSSRSRSGRAKGSPRAGRCPSRRSRPRSSRPVSGSRRGGLRRSVPLVGIAPELARPGRADGGVPAVGSADDPGHLRARSRPSATAT